MFRHTHYLEVPWGMQGHRVATDLIVICGGWFQRSRCWPHS